MFRPFHDLRGYALQAKDGEIGHVQDLYFDASSWAVRYLVVNTGNWLAHRSVLISPASMKVPRWDERILPVELTQEQVKQSPGLEADRPVSRQYEEALRIHYGWAPYWGSFYGNPIEVAPPTVSPEPVELTGDPHLFSAEAVRGHHVAARDGEVGHIHDFLIDDHLWTVGYLVIDTRNWWAGRKVILSPAWSTKLDWPQRRIHMDLTRDAIKASPAYDPEKMLSSAAAAELHDYYGRPRYPAREAEVEPGKLKS